MKKIVLSLIFIVVVMTSKAQIQYGAKAGLNIATWKGEHADDIGERESHLHIHAGVLVNIPITDRINVQPELLYSGEGVKYDFYYVDADRQKLGYLNIPVLVQYNHPLGFFAETGPQVGLLLSAKLGDGKIFVDNKDDFKKTDLKWILGVGFKSKYGAGINIRYNMGLVELYDEADLKVKNSVIGIGLFYMFSAKK